MPQAPLQDIQYMSCNYTIYLKGVLLHSRDNILEEYLGGQGVAMVDYRLHIWPIPAVNLQTATAFPQSTVPHTCKHTHKHMHKHRGTCTHNQHVARL